MIGITQPFREHLQELKKRLVACLLVICVGGVIGYIYYAQILIILLHPLQQTLYYSSPAGGFDLVFKISLLTGLLLALPFCIYQLLHFTAPAFPVPTQHLIIRYVLASTILLILGVFFAYFVCLPAALHFLSGFGAEQITPLISTQEYFSFLMRYILGLGLLFQLPLVLLIMNRVSPLPVSKLLRSGRYVILGSFILGALLTPTPDIINQSILSLPIIVLYYGSVVIIGITNKSRYNSWR